MAMCKTASCLCTRDYLEQELLEASNFFNQHFAGMSFEQVRALDRQRALLLAGRYFTPDAGRRRGRHRLGQTPTIQW